MQQGVWGLVSVFTIGGVLGSTMAFPARTPAQIKPDPTLGREQSILIPHVPNSRGPIDRIDGGAVRGTYLFHSFSDFNVGRGQQVFFANPNGIHDIISRVTGNTRSDIYGTLGVLGSANLFLLNPNGIVFGPEAQLDIRGSLIATTSDRLLFDNGYAFSATTPEGPPLLQMNAAPGLGPWLSTPGGWIVSRGELSVGADLTLAAADLNLRGQVRAGGDLNLLASGTLTVRDSATVPFIASAGRELVMQGDRALDIVAITHPGSGVFSGGNMVLRSRQAVTGDAQFTAGGHFAVEQPNGRLGDLVSPGDPVFEVGGDFRLRNFTGASLQILAGGSVTIPGEVTINAAGGPFNDSTVILSNDRSLTLRGTTEPTLDVRAGTTRFFGSPTPGTPSSANISIGSIINPGGLVFLSNQVHPNSSLTGNITVGQIDTADRDLTGTGGGAIVVDSRGRLEVGFLNASGGDLSTFNIVGNGGDITLLAEGNIVLPYPSNILSIGLAGGAISLDSNSAIRQEDAPFGTDPNILSSIQSVTLAGIGGDITLTAPSIALGGNVLTVLAGGGQGGHLFINAETFTANQATLATQTVGDGDAGNVVVNATSTALDFSFLGSFSLSQVGGDGGNVRVITTDLTLTTGAQIGSLITPQGPPGVVPPTIGNAGNVTVIAKDSVSLSGFQPPTLPFIGQFAPSAIFSSAAPGTEGDSGNVTIRTRTLSLDDGATVGTNVGGIGDAGQIEIRARDAIFITGAVYVDFDGTPDEILDTHPSGINSEVFTGAVGQGGDITIETPILEVTNGGTITASTDGQGDAGDIDITATQFVLFDGLTAFEDVGLSERRSGAGVITGENAAGEAGILTITTPSLRITGGAQLTAETRGSEDAGDLIFNISDSLLLEGSGTGILANSTAGSTGAGGSIFIDPGIVVIQNGARIAVDSQGAGAGGDIEIRAEFLRLENQGLISAETASNAGGNIILTVDDVLSLQQNSRISTTAGTAGAGGDGGNIEVSTRFLVAVPNDNSDITANAFTGRGGRVDITAEGIFGLTPRSRADLEVLLNTSDPSQLDPAFLPTSDITAISQSNPGLSGTVVLQTPDVDPSKGVVALPSGIVDASRLIAGGCSANSAIATNSDTIGNFILTGRGGLPQGPTEALRNEGSMMGWETLDGLTTTTDSVELPSANLPPTPLVEAQSFMMQADGQMVLVAQATDGTTYNSWRHPMSCSNLTSNP